MQSMGHDVHLWVPGDEQTPFEQLSECYGLAKKFEITWLPSASYLKRYDFTVSSLRAVTVWQPDLIYTWLPQAAWGGSAILKNPVVLEIHDRATGKFGLFWLKRFMEATPMKELVVVSNALQRALELQTGFSFLGNEVIDAPNGVDLRRFKDLPDSSEARKTIRISLIN